MHERRARDIRVRAVADEHKGVARRVNLDNSAGHADLARVLQEQPALADLAGKERHLGVQAAQLGSKPRYGCHNTRFEAPVTGPDAQRPMLWCVIEATSLQFETVAAVDFACQAPPQPLNLQNAFVRRHRQQADLGKRDITCEDGTLVRNKQHSNARTCFSP